MKKIYAIIVTYFPKENIFKMIKNLKNQNVNLILVDNTDIELNLIKEVENLLNTDDLLIKLGENKGLGFALNVGVEISIKNNSDFLITLDQDSDLPIDYISKMINFFEKYNENYQIGSVSPNFYDINSHTFANFTILDRFSMRSFKCEESKDIYKTSFAITSGSFYPIEIFKKLGKFREDFFIDHIDTEFCLRMQINGYHCLINPKITINHAIGERKIKRFLGLNWKPNNHNFIRRYYISRNGIVVLKKYFFKVPSFFLLNTLRMIHEIGCVLFFESSKKTKLYKIIHGLFDGLLGKTGKLNS